jgi:hypothetical protein
MIPLRNNSESQVTRQAPILNSEMVSMSSIRSICAGARLGPAL